MGKWNSTRAQAQTQAQVAAEQVVQHLVVPAFVIDESHRVICWNRACEELTGLSEVTMIGSDEQWKGFYSEKRPSLADLILDHDLDKLAGLYPVVSTVDMTEGGSQVEGWFDRVGGERRYLALSAAPIRSAKGEIVGAIELIYDLTHLKADAVSEDNRDAYIHQVQKMNAVSRLAGGIAHDFNNLLTAILGYSRLIKESLDETAPLREDVEEIIRAGEKGARLTKQLLAISRKQVIQPRPVNLSAVLADILPTLRQRAGKNIQIQTDCEHELVSIQGDNSLLEQIFVQLLLNARDAMPNGGRVSFRIANTELDEAFCRRHEGLPVGKYALLMVDDTGCGMSKEVHDHLFEPFFSTKKKGKGMGLGLSMVYGIVRQMDGHIEVETAEGSGTRFSVYFPAIQQGAPERIKPDSEKEVETGHETVLVVEDEDMVRNLAVLILKSLGYRVLEASDGREALKIAKRYEKTIHLVLTDVVMPHIGGLELVRQLRPVRRDFKVLYTSGFTDGRLLDHGLLDGSHDILLKPYTRENLARAVREILDR